MTIAIANSDTASVSGLWWQDAVGTFEMNFASMSAASLGALTFNGTGTITVTYDWFWFEAISECNYSRGGGQPSSFGVFEMPDGMTIRIEYESTVDNEGVSWGGLKAWYR